MWRHEPDAGRDRRDRDLRDHGCRRGLRRRAAPAASRLVVLACSLSLRRPEQAPNLRGFEEVILSLGILCRFGLKRCPKMSVPADGF